MYGVAVARLSGPTDCGWVCTHDGCLTAGWLSFAPCDLFCSRLAMASSHGSGRATGAKVEMQEDTWGPASEPDDPFNHMLLRKNAQGQPTLKKWGNYLHSFSERGKENHICFSLSDLPHSVWQSLYPSMFLQLVQFHSFLWLSNIRWYICATSSLSIPLRTFRLF